MKAQALHCMLYAARRTPHAARHTPHVVAVAVAGPTTNTRQSTTPTLVAHHNRLVALHRTISHPTPSHALPGPGPGPWELGTSLEPRRGTSTWNSSIPPPVLAPCLGERDKRDKRNKRDRLLVRVLRRRPATLPTRPGPPNGRQGCVGTRGH